MKLTAVLCLAVEGRALAARAVARRAAIAGALTAPLLHRGMTAAAADAAGEKMRGLPISDVIDFVTRDITERQFLVTGDLTRSICATHDAHGQRTRFAHVNSAHGQQMPKSAPSRTR